MNNITITQFADTLHHDAAALVERMKRDQIMQGTDPARPYQEYVRRGYFDVAELGGRPLDVTLTNKGQIWLARLYPAGAKLGAAQ
jgi:phage antirepressor YoqD-like protein